MSQQINDNFQLLAGLPIEKDMQKAIIADRDAINSTKRWQGMTCFVIQTQTLYQLQGGVTNADWVGIAGDNVSNGLETIIDGFYVLLAGKTTPLDFEVGDKFRGWIGSRYLVGEILSLPVSLPSDIDNPAKVLLAVDSSLIGEPGTIDYPLLATPTTVFLIPSGKSPKAVYVNQARWFILSANNTTKNYTYTVTDNEVTLKSPGAPTGALVSIDYQ